MQQLQVTTAVIMKHTRLSKYNCKYWKKLYSHRTAFLQCSV